MTEWRHVGVEPCQSDRHLSLSVTTACGCTTPTPDPDSPCAMCGLGNEAMHRKGNVTYLPTRCTCGHPIEADR